MKRRAWVVAGAMIVIAVVVLGVWGGRVASEFDALAHAGLADAHAGAKSLEAKQPAEAKASFDRARVEFIQARDLLGPAWLRGLPWLGRQLVAADDLSTIGVEGSVAGAATAQMISQATAVTGADRLNKILTTVRPHLDTALSSLVTVADRIEGLSSEGLVPRLAEATAEVQELTGPWSVVLHRSQALLNLERFVFAQQHRLLLVSQNSAELRPTGGFMGSYGLVEFGPEGFQLTKYASIETLPRDTLNLPIPPGGQVNYNHYYFRNSNWWMDFPTSANQMLPFWANLKQPAVDGIIAIDIPAIRDLLTLFGPITVPESKVPLSAENVMDQLTYIVEYKMVDAGPDKKQVLASLAEELLHRISTMKEAQLPSLAETLVTSANEKHIQLYFVDARAQADMVAIGWSGAINAPAEATDVLAVSNGVIKPSKANLGVTKSLDYQVSLAADGSAKASLRLGYQKSPKLLKGTFQQWLANYARAHRAAGTTLSTGSGPGTESLADATGLPTFGHYLRVNPGGSGHVLMLFDVPHAARPSVDGKTWHYQLLLAKQADLVDTAATVRVTAPNGWRIAGSAARWRVSEDPVPASVGPTEVTLTTPLKQDLILDVDLVNG